MFSRKYRFHGHKALNFVYRQGKTLRHPSMALRYVNNERQQHFRVAVVVSKKVSSSAVKRNRIRRRIYNAVSGSQSINKLVAYDLVFSAFQEQLGSMPFDELQEIVDKLLSQIPKNAPSAGLNSGGRAIVDEKREQ